MEVTELLARYKKSRDERDFAAVVECSESGLRKYIAARNGSRAAIDDLVQQTFVKAFSRIAEFDPSGSGVGWLQRHARDVIAEHKRAIEGATRKAPLEVVEDGLDSLCSPLRTIEAALIETEELREKNEYSQRVMAFIKSQPEDACEVMMLRMNNWPYRSIAAITGKPIGQVSSIVSRMRKAIREEIGTWVREERAA